MSASRFVRRVSLAILGAVLAAVPHVLMAQVPVRDLVIEDQSHPVRLVGYGLVVGLDNTGDNVFSGRNSAHTVQSITNLLKRFGIEVPAEMLRTRNVAAVLVTAEVSPYLRPGGRFEVQVSSVGDARSLRGGVLWMTPLVSEVGGQPMATAQGSLLTSDAGDMRRRYYMVETSGRIPTGGQVEIDLPRPTFASVTKLLLREPDIGTATRIAAAIDSSIGAGTAKVEDPGAIALTIKDSSSAAVLAKIKDLTVSIRQVGRIVIDGRDGTIVAGGDLSVGPGIVSVGSVTLSIGGPAADTLAQKGELRLAAGASVQQLAAALHAVRTPPSEIARVFEALRRVGSISAEVISR